MGKQPNCVKRKKIRLRVSVLAEQHNTKQTILKHLGLRDKLVYQAGTHSVDKTCLRLAAQRNA